MKYDGDGRATARFFSDKGCRRAPLFTAPAVSPFSDERPSSRFRGIALPSERRRLRYSTVGLTRYRTR
ncbi:hypothetical protein [Escherichia coli]|uniref:hypothetical protein n=1 Tax=Escherichia coli TaxID=562 RepID=UPI00207D2D30|nr:hypothetical protein [Escherichia coli]